MFSRSCGSSLTLLFSELFGGDLLRDLLYSYDYVFEDVCFLLFAQEICLLSMPPFWNICLF